MSQIAVKRLLISAASILVGLAILEAIRRSPLNTAPPWLWFIFIILVALLAGGLNILIELRLIRPTSPNSENHHRERRRLEAEISQLNQEMISRAQEQTAELSRLNQELQLQMAMQKQAEELARANEERFRNMADNIQDGLTILENGQLVYLNQRACDIFGDCPEGDLEARIFKFAAPEERERLRRIIGGAKQPDQFPNELEYWILRNDGERRCVRERYSTSISNGAARIFIVTSDITQAVQAYQTLENAVNERTRELSTVIDVSRRIASTLELEPLLHLILDQMQEIIPYSGAAIFTLEDDQLRVAAYHVPRLPTPDRTLSLSLKNAGPYQQVVLEKRVLILEDIQGDTPLLRAYQECYSNPSGYTFDHAHSWIGIPLIVRDQVSGMLSLTHHRSGFYTQSHARLAMTIADQIAVAIENARLYEQAQNLAVLEERHRIARELHDSVTQLLYGISLYCTAASRSLRNGNTKQVEESLKEIKDDALQALQEMRLLILELDPPMLQKVGLAAALQASLEAIESRTGLETVLTAEGVSRLPKALETELYRIAMEALNNLVRYARAKKVSVDLRYGDGWVWMDICDNGVGFDVTQALNSGGMGLQNMEKRARQLKGRLEIISSPGAGTRIHVEAPIYGARAELVTS
ncbi:MAG: GAF domain-containing protein [Anaerolineales bacterium]|nr:GAF domain-containing protein [Anaerolineales bacterium]